MKRHWNYRIMAKKVFFKSVVEVQYGIHEVHYKDDIPSGFTENPISLSTSNSHFNSDFDPVEFLIWQIDALKIACEKPILDADNFPLEYIAYSRKKKLEMIEKNLQ